MRKLIIIALLFFFAAGTLTDTYAVPARPGVVTLRQKDGSIIRARIHGDEFCNYVTTEEGYNIVGGADGNWYYAELDKSGSLVSTGIKVVPVSRLASAERSRLNKDLRPSMTARQAQKKAWAASSALSAPSSDECPPFLSGSVMASAGKQKSLVILVAFSDVPFRDSSTPEAFDEMMNGRNYTLNGATGSAWQYFYENSNGKFDPEFTVVGPYTLSHERAYYTANDDAKAPEMAAEAARLADADVDFSQYATDGYAYDIFVYYSGGEEADGSDPNGIWPHRSYFDTIEVDGVKLSGYACSGELCFQSDGSVGFTRIGSFCHEFGHTLGLPDFYDTGSSSGTSTPANFSLMDVGCYNNYSSTPPAMNILERWMLGWAEPEVLEADGDYVLQPVTSDAGYMVRSAKGGDYFLLECRGAGRSVWDEARYLDYFGLGVYRGMLVYHVDVSKKSSWRNNSVNVTRGGECFHLIYSDPSYKGYYMPAYIPGHSFFPGSSKVTGISYGTSEGYEARDGGKPEGDISGIALNDDYTVSFSYATRASVIKGIKADVWQHDAIISWSDDDATSWTVTYAPVSGGEALSVTVTDRFAHLPALKAGTSYDVSVVSDRQGAASLTLSTAAKGSGHPRITLSAGTLSSSSAVLFTLSDCGDYSDVQWTVDGAKSDNYRTLTKGERRIQACVTFPDGSKEYYLRYVNVIL